jgi:anaerobic selenocysteine-containing dehydrogenase
MKKIERKDFLKLGGGAILGGATGMVLSGAPFMSFQWLVEWSQDQYVPVKGIEKYIESINNACSNKCKVNVRKILDRAVQISSEEGLCPSCMNSLQLLYHPERLFKPLKKVGKKGSGQFRSVSWEEALKDISLQLNKAGKGDIAGITKSRSVSSDLLEKLIYESGNSEFYYTPDADILSSAVFDGKLSYNFDEADFILSFGAKLFEGWGNSSVMKKLLAEKSDKKIIQIDCNCTRTASMSDEWVNIKAGTEAVLALGIARYLITEKNLTLKDEGFADFSQLIINQYKPGVVFKVTGVKKEKVNELAEALLKAKNPVVVVGRGGVVATSSSAELVAVNTLNRLIKSKNVSIEKYTGLNSFKLKTKSNGLDEFISKGNFKSIIINNANPVYTSVYGDKLSEKLKSSFVVTISPFINDTAIYSEYFA